MKPSKPLAALRKAFGAPEGGEFDPELFLLRLQKAVVDSVEKVEKQLAGMAEMGKTEREAKMAEVKEQAALIAQLVELQRQTKEAVEGHKIEKVVVENVRETPPEKIKVEVDVTHPDAEKKDNEKRLWWMEALHTVVRAPVVGLTEWFQAALDSIRKPEGAIAVRLVYPDGKNFYTALMSAYSAGASVSMATVENLLTTINSALASVPVIGTVADDATTPGNPVMIGGKAVETDGTDPGSVSAEDDVVISRFDRNRRLLVNTAHPNAWTLFEDHTTAQTNNQLKAAPGANLSLYITDVVVSNGATAGSIKLVEDEGGTPVQISQTIYMAINGGAVIHWNTPKRLTANKTLGFTSTTVTTHSIEVHGYIAP